MAIYHFSVKTVARSAGRSATAAIAYRAGEKIYCEREGREHDYSRKTGVEYKEIYLPE
ncbi:mobA/MobL family protein [Acinetobacter baumannii 25691_7]|nr:mobA/MobL family protein [Acinetobacter baumannii 25691_7]